MFHVSLGSGSKSQYLGAFVYILKQYFMLISKKLPYQGGTPSLIKCVHVLKISFFSLTDDIFVICNLKVSKNSRNTYHNMHVDKKMPKSTWYIFQAKSPTVEKVYKKSP